MKRATPAALSSERRALSGTCWRVVEAQHRISTMKLVDTLAEQERLEQILEHSKPPVPPECQHLHHLLSTPFRYGAPYPQGSRFCRAGLTPGVFYGSRTPGGTNLALLTCRAFASRPPLERRTWRLHVDAAGVRAICAFPEARLGLDRDGFAYDPRMSPMRWERGRV